MSIKKIALFSVIIFSCVADAMSFDKLLDISGLPVSPGGRRLVPLPELTSHAEPVLPEYISDHDLTEAIQQLEQAEESSNLLKRKSSEKEEDTNADDKEEAFESKRFRANVVDNINPRVSQEESLFYTMLPPEIIARIAQFLVEPEDLSALYALLRVAIRERDIVLPLLQAIKESEDAKKSLTLIVAPAVESIAPVPPLAAGNPVQIAGNSVFAHNLEHWGIANQGITDLSGIERFEKLKGLDIQGNPIGDTGIQVLAQAPIALVLSNLNIANTGITAASENPLATRFPSLRTLILSDGPELEAIKKALKKYFKLQEQKQIERTLD